MYKRWIGAPAVCMVLMLILAACGGGSNTNGETQVPPEGSQTAGQNPAADSQDPLAVGQEEQKDSASDFYGCWAYEGGSWAIFYEDGTYDLIYTDGDFTTGDYSIEENTLFLDFDKNFTLAEDGALVDDDGDTLFPSEMPGFAPGTPGVSSDWISYAAENFYGCWELAEGEERWLNIYEDGTMEWVIPARSELSGETFSYWLIGDVLYTYGSESFTLEDDGNLCWDNPMLGQSYTLFPSEQPDLNAGNEEDGYSFASTDTWAVGTWYADLGESDALLELREDGRFFWYSSQTDQTMVGKWEAGENEVSLFYISSPYDIRLLADGEDVLKGGNDIQFTRQDDISVPKLTLNTLDVYSWVEPDTENELTIYWDGSWEICDSNYDEIFYEGEEDSIEIEGNTAVLISMDGQVLTMELVEETMELVFDNGMVFAIEGWNN